MTDSMYVPDTLDHDAVNIFDLQQKHAFGILVANVKESSDNAKSETSFTMKDFSTCI